ncbi:hypothetical protein BY458DRAFT_532829 [Sporodiniella umbellata]|nr:hypothetical protein BY458DRAFT_532829 [Sporodiniella umbellata]
MSEESIEKIPLESNSEVEDHAKLTLFVRGLPFDATNGDLEEFFGEIGPVRKCFVVTERKEEGSDKPLRNKGFGYVHYAMEEDAQTALTKLKGTKFKGRKIKIELAKRKAETTAHEDKKAENKSVEEPKEKKTTETPEFEVNARLIVRNLPWKYREADLNKLFQTHGKVHSVSLPRKYEGGPLRGFAFIQYDKVNEAQAAMDALNATEHHGRTIAVDWSISKNRYRESELKAAEATETEDVEMKEADDEVLTSKEGTEDEEEEEEEEEEEDSEDAESDEESDEENDSDSESDSDGEGEEKEDQSTKPVKKQGPAASEGRTLFIRNLLFESTEEDLKELFKQWGLVVYAKITRDPVTRLSRGTGFVCMKKKEDAEKCIEAAEALRNLSQKDQNNDSEAMKQLLSKREKKKKGLMFKSIITPESTTGDGSKFTLHGRVLDVTLAVDRTQAKEIKDANLSQKRKEDKRNLYLMREGVVFPDTPAAETMTPTELSKRQMSFSSRKKMVSNNPALYISKTRLSIRNLPITVDDKELKALGISSISKFKNEVKGSLRTDLSKEEKEDGWHYLPRVKQAKIIRSKDRMDVATNQLRSKGYGFLEFSTHAHALASLRYLNNNPSVFKGKRLIVEFSLENKDVMDRRANGQNDRSKNTSGPEAGRGQKRQSPETGRDQKRQRPDTGRGQKRQRPDTGRDQKRQRPDTGRGQKRQHRK